MKYFYTCSVELDRFDVATLTAALLLLEKTEDLPYEIEGLSCEFGEMRAYDSEEILRLLQRIQQAAACPPLPD